MLKTKQETRRRGLQNPNAVYVFVLLTTPWSPYNYKTLATFKSMGVLIRGLFQNFFGGGRGVGGAISRLNLIIKQSYNGSEHHLIWGWDRAEHLGR